MENCTYQADLKPTLNKSKTYVQTEVIGVTKIEDVFSRTKSKKNKELFYDEASKSTPNLPPNVPSQFELTEVFKIKRDKIGGLGSYKSSICLNHVKGRRHTHE